MAEPEHRKGWGPPCEHCMRKERADILAKIDEQLEREEACMSTLSWAEFALWVKTRNKEE